MTLYNKYIVSLALSIRTNDSDTTTGWNGYLAGYQGKMTKENLQTSYNILYYNILYFFIYFSNRKKIFWHNIFCKARRDELNASIFN